MLGLGLLGFHELGAFGWRWLAVDVVWATLGGLGIGWLLGQLIGRLVVHLRKVHRAALGLDDFLAIALIALAYGVAHLVAAYGFLAVFAAGLALRHIELEADGEEEPSMADLEAREAAEASEKLATDEKLAPAYMAAAVLGFNEQLERIGEVAMVVILGALLIPLLPALTPAALWFIPLLFLVIRPVAVLIGLIGSRTGPVQRGLIGWFGIRGIGSIYYLMYAITHGVEGALAEQLAALTAVTIAASIVIHGVSVTPLMQRYSALLERRSPPEGVGDATAP
jgi:sodium/hydrogen antiporter